MGTSAVMNRKLKEVPTSIIMFYHSFIGAIITLAVIVIQKATSGNEIEMLTYSKYQWMFLLLGAFMSPIGITAQTVAF